MGKVSFRDLFKKDAIEKLEHEESPVTTNLDNGDIFPEEDLPIQLGEYLSSIVCIISLTCKGCVELLPNIKSFTEHYDGQFVLICTGSETENEAIAKHFGFDFPMISMSDGEYRRQYGVRGTPYAFLMKHGVIEENKMIQQAAELYAMAQLGKEMS